MHQTHYLQGITPAFYNNFFLYMFKMIGSLLTILIILSEFGAKGWASEVITTKNPLSSVGAIEILNNNLQILS